MEWSDILNEAAKQRQPSAIRKLAYLMDKKDIHNLAGGIPNPVVFPFESATLKLRDGSQIDLNGSALERAFNYTQSSGNPELVDLVKKLVRKYHNPPRFDEREFLIITGVQDGIEKLFANVCNPGDNILIQEPIYNGILGAIAPYRANMIGVDADEKGMRVDSLREKLSRWKPGDKDVPKVLYVNPTSSNPTGMTYTLERRQEIYKIAQEYNLLICEDDAYYFLQYPNKNIPSFLSLDVDCRVLRMDSFSKIIAPGLRLGYACGPPALLEKMHCHIQAATQMPNAVSQMIVYKLLTQWGDAGFQKHVDRVCAYYTRQRDTLVESCEKWLTGLAEWNVPDGGMFLWIKVLGIPDVNKFATTGSTLKEGVVVLPGAACYIDYNKPSQYVRVCFSFEQLENLDKAMKLLATAIKREQILQSK